MKATYTKVEGSAYLTRVKELLEMLQGSQHALPLSFSSLVQAALHVLLMPLVDGCLPTGQEALPQNDVRTVVLHQQPHDPGTRHIHVHEWYPAAQACNTLSTKESVTGSDASESRTHYDTSPAAKNTSHTRTRMESCSPNLATRWKLNRACQQARSTKLWLLKMHLWCIQQHCTEDTAICNLIERPASQ